MGYFRVLPHMIGQEVRAPPVYVVFDRGLKIVLGVFDDLS